MANQTPLAAQTADAVLVEDSGFVVPAHFGNVAEEYDSARKGAVLFDRSHHGKIEVAGNDAAVFLHNLSTNDVKTLSPGSGCETFFCTPTAKVVSHALLFRDQPQGKHERLWLDLMPGLSEKTFRHLDRYIIGEDVTLTDHTTALCQIHVAGPNAATLLTAALGEEPMPWVRCAFRWLSSGLCLRCVNPLGLPGYDLLCPQEQAIALWQRLVAGGARPAGRDAWEMLRVEAGTPLYGIDIDESTFAPEVGRTAAISYNKGCYLGQEPIVMARDRGVVQRTLVGLLVGDEPAAPGSLLYRDGKEVGRTTSSSLRSPQLGTAVALAYVRRGSQTPLTELEMVSSGGRRTVRVVKLPLV
jgi:folate-binding protein YgfZ